MSEDINVMLKEVDVQKEQLSALRPLPEEALKKIQDALDIEYTYESNRIEGNTLTLQETALVVNESVTFRDSVKAYDQIKRDYLGSFEMSVIASEMVRGGM